MLLPFFLFLWDNEQMDGSSSIPDPNESVDLASIFDIRIGLVKDRYLNRTRDSGEEVHFVTLKSFTNVTGKKEDGSLNEYFQLSQLDPYWLQSLKNNALNSSSDLHSNRDEPERIPVKDDKVLKKEDYLITIRGMPFGYSLLNNSELETLSLVPTHHLIRLRPLDGNGMYIPYFHLLLDHLVKFKFAKDFNRMTTKNDGTKESYAKMNSIKVDDLKKQIINYHSKMQDQKKVYESYVEQHTQWQKHNLAFQLYQMKFFNKIH